MTTTVDPATRGRLISFEGGEGAGKSTQVARLAKALGAAGADVVTTREPGGSPSAERIRSLLLTQGHAWQPLTEALLHAASRCEHLARTVRPALEAGRWVLTDRFLDSTRAYQGYGQGLGDEAVDVLENLVAADARPDLTLILDIDPAIGLARAGRDPDRYESMDRSFHARVREGYRRLAEAEPQRCVLVDADRAADAVAADVRAAVRARLDVPGLAE